MRWDGPLAIVTLPAEIDVVNVRELDEELNSLLSVQHASPLIVDMTHTRFCDSAGIAALVRAWKRACVLETGLRVVVTSEPVIRVMQVLGADRVLEVYPRLDAAIAEEPQAS